MKLPQLLGETVIIGAKNRKPEPKSVIEKMEEENKGKPWQPLNVYHYEQEPKRPIHPAFQMRNVPLPKDRYDEKEWQETHKKRHEKEKELDKTFGAGWWDKMSNEEKKTYLENHPGSKYAKGKK